MSRQASRLGVSRPNAQSLFSCIICNMYLCYVDESGTSAVPGTTSHFVLSGLAVHIANWKRFDEEIRQIKANYSLQEAELHTAWILRPYVEQNNINDFASLPYLERRARVTSLRNQKRLQLQNSGRSADLKKYKKYVKHTEDYVHLTSDERRSLIREVAACVASWNDAYIFAECIDKIHFDPNKTRRTVDEQAFEQIVSRFHHFLVRQEADEYGLVIHDNNETVARKHTELMMTYHTTGTLWTTIDRIMETPLFVDSKLTSMVQLSDLCGYALRRYVENGEEELFDLIFQRADNLHGSIVGVRHFTNYRCRCKICQGHRKTETVKNVKVYQQ